MSVNTSEDPDPKDVWVYNWRGTQIRGVTMDLTPVIPRGCIKLSDYSDVSAMNRKEIDRDVDQYVEGQLEQSWAVAQAQAGRDRNVDEAKPAQDGEKSKGKGARKAKALLKRRSSAESSNDFLGAIGVQATTLTTYVMW